MLIRCPIIHETLVQHQSLVVGIGTCTICSDPVPYLHSLSGCSCRITHSMLVYDVNCTCFGELVNYNMNYNMTMMMIFGENMDINLQLIFWPTL